MTEQIFTELKSTWTYSNPIGSESLNNSPREQKWCRGTMVGGFAWLGHCWARLYFCKADHRGGCDCPESLTPSKHHYHPQKAPRQLFLLKATSSHFKGSGHVARDNNMSCLGCYLWLAWEMQLDTFYSSATWVLCCTKQSPPALGINTITTLQRCHCLYIISQIFFHDDYDIYYFLNAIPLALHLKTKRQFFFM